MTGLRRASVIVPRDEEEIAIARLLDLSPDGLAAVERGAEVELMIWLESEAEEARLREIFPRAILTPVASGWEETWKRFHLPVVVGPLWVGPPWLDPEPGLVPVVIDPGRAFGTGAHETTRLCLELMLGLERGSLVDLGCGSGVVAVAAAKLGFAPVSALDSDEAAIEATQANAAANGVELEVILADVLVGPAPAADVAVVNIELATVRALAPGLDSAFVITAGYLDTDDPPEFGFRHLRRRREGAWAADLYTRE